MKWFIVWRVGIVALQLKHIILEYALQNITISYDRIKDSIFEILSILRMLLQIFHRFIDNITKKIIQI